MRKWMTDKLFLYHWVRISILLFIYDIIVMNVSYGLALWLRFDFRFSDIPYDYLTTWVKYIPIHTACTLILMFAFKLYRSMWRFASFDELSRTSIVCAISMALHIVGTTVVFQRMPISYYVMGGPAVYPDHGYPVFLPDLPDAEDPYNSGIGIQRDQEYNDHRGRRSRACDYKRV